MYHLITYGDNRFTKSKKRLYEEALDTTWFNTITIYDQHSLDSNFKNKYKTILAEPKCGGFCIWKPYVVKKKLDEINFNDYLVYIDAGCTINKKAESRFYEYIKMVDEHDIISFQLTYIEKSWTTNEIFNYFNCNNDEKILNTGQYVGGILIMKKTEKVCNMINEWYNCLIDDCLLFTNHYNNLQDIYFRNNRHDQSVFSVIRKLRGSMVLQDETYFAKFGSGISMNYPFWATRIRK